MGVVDGRNQGPRARHRTRLGVLNKLQHLAHGDSFAFIANGESSQLRIVVVGLNADQPASLNASNANLSLLHKVRRLLALPASLLVNQVLEVSNLHLLNEGVHVHDGGVSGAHDVLEVQNDELGVEEAGGLDRGGGVAEHKAGGDILLLHTTELEQHVVSAPGELGGLIVNVNANHLNLRLVGHDQNRLVHLDSPRLNLATHNGSHVPELVGYRHAKGCGIIPLDPFHLVQVLEE